MARFEGSDEFRGAEFVDLDLTDALFREVDLSRVRMYGVLLTDGDLDGDIRGLRLNGVEVAPLVEAELDRQHPERTKLRATTPAGLAEALSTVEAMWAPTIERARALPAAELDRSVNDEWSFLETLRHLVFVVDSWFGAAVLGRPEPFHRLGLLPAFLTDDGVFGHDQQARPSLDEVLAARSERLAEIGEFLATVAQADLDRPRVMPADAGWPPPGTRTAIACLHTIFGDDWAHHQFAVRDLAIIEAG